VNPDCPTCNVPLQTRSGESERESGDAGEYTRVYVSYWWSLTCPKCRRSTGPRGAQEWAAKDVEAWKEAAA
jgi:uncharacterized protein with PIN domain